ncbi:MAG: hypothetical protein JWM47_4587 [Acidimicrobiales bacterium]|nr:hypothetical protein [Acidimicrobiales bacterium]
MSEVLSYKYPPINPEVSANSERWTEVKPINGSVFRSDQNQSIILNLASASEFVKTVQSFLTATIVPRNAQGAVVSESSISYQGVSRAFSRLQIRIGSAVVEDISQYSDILALYYSTASKNRKSILKRLEGYSNPDFLDGDSGRKFVHMLMSSLFCTPQALPLPFISAGGVSIELTLAPASELFTSNGVSYYTMENVSFKYLAVTPNPAYTMAMTAAVASGKSCFIPYQRIHIFPSAGNGANNQIIQVPIGMVSSIVSVDTTFHDTTAYANATNDKSLRFTSAGLTEWNLVGAGINNPSQISFGYSGGADPETVLMSLLSESGNGYRMGEELSLDDNYESKSFRLGLNFQSSQEYFGSGLSTVGSASPFLTINTKHSQPVPPTTQITTIVTTDALIQFQGSGITVTEIF